MSKKTNERPVFPFTSIVGQEEMYVLELGRCLKSRGYKFYNNKINLSNVFKKNINKSLKKKTRNLFESINF